MKWRIAVIAALAVALGSLVARAQFVLPGGQGIGAPGTPTTALQFNTNGLFAGISTVTSDQANVAFSTSSQLILYGITALNCLQVNANHQIIGSGASCGGTGSPGGNNTEVQFNTNGTFGGISGAVSSDASSIRFSTNSLVINGQAISKVSGNTGTLATVTGVLSSNCIKGDGSGNLIDAGTSCGGGTPTSIAAGTNITTSGTSSNITINAVPSGNHEFVQYNTNGIFGADNGFFYKGNGNVKIALGTYTSTSNKALEITGAFGDASVKFDAPFYMDIATATSAAESLFMDLRASGTSVFWVDQDGEIKARFNTAKFNNELKVGGTILSNTSGDSNFIGTASGTFGSGDCVRWDATGNLVDSGSASCGGLTSNTSIAAGSNIATSGTASNVTVAVIATPTFTTVNLTGNLTGTTAQFSSLLTGTSAQFQTITDSGITGTQCLQSVNGVLGGTGVSCATQVATPSIAAGSSIQTYGSASNITVAVSPAGASTQLQYNNAGALGAITGATANGTAVSFATNGLVINGQSVSKISGNTATLASITGTLSGNCIQSDASGNLVDSGTACGGGPGTSTSIAAGSNITTSGTASNVTVNVVSTPSFSTVILTDNLTGTTAQLSGLLTGTSAVFQTITDNGLGASNTCVQATNGVLAATGTSCSTVTTVGVAGSNLSIQYNNAGSLGGNAYATLTSTGTIAAANYTNTPANSGNMSFTTPDITQFGDGGINANGYINWEGESRVTATHLSITSAVLTPTGLSVNLLAGRTYAVDVDLYIGTTLNTGGIQVALTGTWGGAGAVTTGTRYFGYVVDDNSSTFAGAGTGASIRGAAMSQAKNGVVANTNLSGPTAYVKISGTIDAGSSGTLQVWAAQSVANATRFLTIGRGSRMIVHDMP